MRKEELSLLNDDFKLKIKMFYYRHSNTSVKEAKNFRKKIRTTRKMQHVAARNLWRVKKNSAIYID